MKNTLHLLRQLLIQVQLTFVMPRFSELDEKEIEEVNLFNARQINDFFNALIDESENL